MNFEHDGSNCKVTSKNSFSYILSIIATCGICWALLLDSASIELICHRGKCVLTQQSLAHRRGFFGTLRGSFQVLFPSGRSRRHFAVDKFRRALVKEVEKGSRRNVRYDVYLVMDELQNLNSVGEMVERRVGGGGGSGNEQQDPEEIFWNSYKTAAAAEYDAVIIEGSMHRHCEASSASNDRSSSVNNAHDDINPQSEVTAPPVHASVDNVSWDELFLALSIALLYYGIALCPNLEVIVINQECGVITVERQTILSSKQQSVLPGSVTPSFAGGGTVLLLAPVSLVADIESTRHVRTHNRTTTVSWGLQIRMRDARPPLKLRCGLTVSNQWRNDEDASRLRAALRLAGFDGGNGANNSSNRRLDSQVNAAIGLRRVAAHQAENSNNEGRTDIHHNGSNGAAGGGGEPGGCCVVCLEKKARVAFAPCAHVCCCEDCGQSQALTVCPICRSPIVHRIGLYFST